MKVQDQAQVAHGLGVVLEVQEAQAQAQVAPVAAVVVLAVQLQTHSLTPHKTLGVVSLIL